jgi:hypothetical protein
MGYIGGGAGLVTLAWRAYLKVITAVGKPTATPAPAAVVVQPSPEYADKSLRDLIILAHEDIRATRSDISELKADVSGLKVKVAIIEEHGKLRDVADELEDTLTDVKTDLKAIRQSNAEITGNLKAVTSKQADSVRRRSRTP